MSLANLKWTDTQTKVTNWNIKIRTDLPLSVSPLMLRMKHGREKCGKCKKPFILGEQVFIGVGVPKNIILCKECVESTP